MQWDAPDDVETGGGNWLKEPGTYHAIVVSVDENPASRDGKALDAFRVTLQVLDGTTKDQRDKQVEILFWNPKLTDKNEGLFARQKQAKFLLATGLITESQLGQKGLQIDLQQAKARQIVLTIEESERDGKKYVDLSYANIWHVDDPETAKFPKDAAALKLLPAAHRRKPESFKSNGSGDNKPQSQQPVAAEAATNVDLKDL